LLSLGARLVDDGQYFGFPHDEELLAIELDLLARVLAEEDQISRLDVERHARAVLSDGAAPGGDHGAALRFLFCGVGNDDAADLLLTFFKAANDEAIVEWSDIHVAILTLQRPAGCPLVHSAVSDWRQECGGLRGDRSASQCHA
jgi:hypothetical protein